MDPEATFAPTYAEARRRFLVAARARGAAIESLPNRDVVGIEGEPLAMDVALVGAPDAAGLLVLSSGLHGVEGFCGSGCQVALLQDDEVEAARAASGVALLFIHALNPWGFSHGRRVNEDNADVNRNFIDFDAALPVNAAYAELHHALVPPTWPPAPENEAVLARFAAQHGGRAFQAAVSSGQYAFPDGLFYGGARPAWTNRTLRAVLRRHAARCARLGWIDFHTGLGPAGHGEKIYAGHDDPVAIARARSWWGDDVTNYYDQSSTSAPLLGEMYLAAYEECPQAQYTGIALEYGTVPLDEVFTALREDHWVAKHPEAPAALRESARRRMRGAFFTDTPEWKAAVLRQARAGVLAALAPLAAE